MKDCVYAQLCQVQYSRLKLGLHNMRISNTGCSHCFPISIAPKFGHIPGILKGCSYMTNLLMGVNKEAVSSGLVKRKVGVVDSSQQPGLSPWIFPWDCPLDFESF